MAGPAPPEAVFLQVYYPVTTAAVVSADYPEATTSFPGARVPKSSLPALFRGGEGGLASTGWNL